MKGEARDGGTEAKRDATDGVVKNPSHERSEGPLSAGIKELQLACRVA